MFTFQALQLLLFLIPGLFASTIFNFLVNRKVYRSDLSQIIEALIFSMIIYTIYSAIRQTSAVTLDQSNEIINYLFDPLSFFILILISFVLPIILAFFMNKNLHLKPLIKLGVSSRSARLTAWDDAFHEYSRYVVIHFEDGRRLYGWPQYVSEGLEEQYILVYKPYWIDDSGDQSEFVNTELDALLITPAYKIISIGFYPENFKVKEIGEQENEKK